ncbi:MAG TPA: right-handed parallel beta-helix repeat-containing protein, partial [Gemmataceae bacterium]|nr:right-handed parallel beta-helix repeat-containing protein [Gemmataceae bacterium]
GASIVAGGTISITSTNQYDVKVTSGNASFGQLAVGAGFAIANVRNNTEAYAGNFSTMTAGGAVTVQATEQDSQHDGTQVTSIGAAAGLIGIADNVATLNVVSNTTARLKDHAAILGGGDVTISANQQSNLVSSVQGLAGGIAAAGGCTNTVIVTANVTANVGNGAVVGTSNGKVGSLTVLAVANNAVGVGTQAGEIGLLASVSGGEGTGTINVNETSSIGSAAVNATGAVAVAATSSESVHADTDQLATGIIDVGGPAKAIVEINGAVTAFVGNAAVINAASLVVNAVAGNTAHAEGSPIGIGVVNVKAADMEAHVKANTEAYVFATAITVTGSAGVTATASSTAIAECSQTTYGGIAQGAPFTDAEVGGFVKAHMDGATVSAGSVTVAAKGTVNALTSMDSSNGGLLAGQNNTAIAKANPEIDAYVTAGLMVTTGDVEITAHAETTATAQIYGISRGALAAGNGESTATDSPTVNASIGAFATINAGGNLTVQSLHNTETGFSAGSGAKATAEMPAFGVGAMSGCIPTAASDATVASLVNTRAVIHAGNFVFILAKSTNKAIAHADASTTSIVGFGKGDALVTVNGPTSAHMDGKLTGAVSLNVSATATNTSNATAFAGGGGLIDDVGAIASTTINPRIEAAIGSGSDATTANTSGDISVTAAAVDDATANALASSSVFFLSLGSTNSSAVVKPTVNAFIESGSTISTSAGNINVLATHNIESNGTVTPGTGTHAKSQATSGGALDIVGASANATSDATVTSQLGAQSIVAAGNVSVITRADNAADALAPANFAGILAYGGMEAHSIANGTARADVADATNFQVGGNLTVLARGASESTATATADSGGVLNIAGSKATADAAPLIIAVISSPNVVNVAGDINVTALGQGNPQATANGGGGGVLQVGSSVANASWKPVIRSILDDHATLKSGGDITIAAADNNNENLQIDTTRFAKATATATGGGLLTSEAAAIFVTVDSLVNTIIGIGADIQAGKNLAIYAFTYNDVEGNSNGFAAGLVSGGSTDATATIGFQTLAGTDDTTSSSPTVLHAGSSITVLSNSDNVANFTLGGSGGGLAGIGGAVLSLHVNNPLTQARLGNATIVNAPAAGLQVLARNENDYEGHTEQTTVSGISENVANTFIVVNNSLTLAEIGANVQITVAQFELTADDADLNATAIANSSCFALGATNDCTAQADEITAAKVHVSAGTTINSATSLVIAAKADSVATHAFAKPEVTAGLATCNSTANSTKTVSTEVDLDAGSILTAGSVNVSATRPDQIGGNTYIRIADKDNTSATFGLGDSQDVNGAETFSNVVNLNSNITIIGSVLHTLTVDDTRKVVAGAGLVLTDGTNPLGLGDRTTTGKLVITTLTNGNGSNLVVSAPHGTTAGFSNLTFDANSEIVINNASDADLYLCPMSVLDNGGGQVIVQTADQPNWTFSQTTAPDGGLVNINNTNAFDGDIHLTGPIINPTGQTFLTASGGNIVGDVPNAFLITPKITLAAGAQLGTTSQALQLQILGSTLQSGLIERATAGSGINLDVLPVSNIFLAPSVVVNNVDSVTGNVNLRFEDGLATGNPAADSITLQTIRAEAGNVTISAGNNGSSPQSTVHLADQIISLQGTASISTAAGSIVSDNPAQLVQAKDITLAANTGSIGSASANVFIKLGTGRLSASAQGDIDITSISGTVLVGSINSTQGNVQLITGSAVPTGANISLDASSTIHAGGSVTISAGNNVSIDVGSKIQAATNILIQGAFGNAAVGTKMSILGTMQGQQVSIQGSASQDDLITLSRPDATPTSVTLGSGTDRVNINKISGLTTITEGNGNTTVTVGFPLNALQTINGGAPGVLDPITAPLNIVGGNGFNVLNINDGASTVTRTGTLTNSTFVGLGITGAGITFTKIAAVNITLGGGANALTLANTITGTTTVNGGTGPDSINVQATAGPTNIIGGNGSLTVNAGSLQPAQGGIVDLLAGALTVTGGTGTSSLFVDDSGSPGAKTGQLTFNTLTGLGMAGITYASLASVNIVLGSGNDTFTIAGTHNGSTTLSCGPGNDTVVVQSTRGPTTINAGAGNDTINVFSTGAPLTVNGGTGSAVVNLFSVADVTTFNAGGGYATINVQSIDGATTINGDGLDVINVGSLAPAAGGTVHGIRAALTVNGMTGMDLLHVDDAGATLPETLTLAATTLTGLDMSSGITFANLAALQIALGAGGTNVTIAGTHPGSTVLTGGISNDSFVIQSISGNTLLQGGGGDDSFAIGGNSLTTLHAAKTISAPLLLDGGSGNNSLSVSIDASYVLTDANVQVADGPTIGISAVRQVMLTGGPLDSTFDVSGWTGNATLIGGDGLDQVVSSVDANAVLTDASLTRSNGASLTLNGIGAAIVGGGASNNTLDATGFSGNAWLYGGGGNDTLLAGSGNNYLDGGAGQDTLTGSSGTDILVGQNGNGDTIHAGTHATTIYGSPFADTIVGSPGNDLIYGGGGNDNIDAAAGNDTIVGGTGAAVLIGGAGNDLIFDAGTGNIFADRPQSLGNASDVDIIYGGGQDTINAGAGNAIIYNQGGTNVITGGGPGKQVYNVAAGTVPLPTPGSIPTPAQWPPAPVNSAATLPTGVDVQGRWTELEGSASNGGLSNGPGQAVESSTAAGALGQFVAWSDSRSGQYEIYVAQHTATGWQQLAGSAQGGGISVTAGAARRPSLALNAAGLPLVAYTVFNGTSNDIYVAQFDPSANGGQGGWVGLGTSLQSGGISGSGKADNAVIVETAAGPVVAWLDSTLTTTIQVKTFVSGNWVDMGIGGATGLSGAPSPVTNIALATDGAKVALAWSRVVSGKSQVFLLENSGGAWNQLAGSASLNGVSNSSGGASAPTVAFAGGALYLAWQDSASGVSQIYAATFNGTAWQPAGAGAASGGGISTSAGPATQPALSSGGGQLWLAWIDNEFPTAPANAATLYAKRWNGSAFVEQVRGDAQLNGITGSLGISQSPALAVDQAGHPLVSWTANTSGNPQISVLANAFDVGTIHYVSAVPGNDANDGLTSSTPKKTVQAVLNDAAHPVHSGDVILIQNGTYAGAIDFSAVPAGVLVQGAGIGVYTFSGPITGTNVSGLTLSNLTIAGGVTFTGGSHIALTGSTISGPGINVSGGSSIQLIHDTFNTTGTAITLAGAVNGVTIDNNTATSTVNDIAVTGSVTGLDVRGNTLGGSGTGIALTAAAGGNISGNNISTATTGISITAPFTGPLTANNIHGAHTGVNYQAGAGLGGNDIHANFTGIVSTVSDSTNGLGFVAGTLPNQIFGNGVGVALTGVMQNQHVFDNQTGVTGSGALVASDLAHANVLEANTVTVNFNGPIEYNRITRSAIGIQAQSGQLVAYNLIYRNTQAGIAVNGQTRVSIVNNTMFAPSGDNVAISGGSTENQLLNNILWASSGFDINVANDSQKGFFSDFNDLHADGTGKLVHWDVDFNDILDWQVNVAQFDLHSVGDTVLNPTLATPRIAGVAIDDYRVTGLFAGLRSSSSTINAGDALTDQAVPATLQNLLTNPSFETGISGWAASPSGGTQSANPTAWQGSSYFFAGPNTVTTLDQTVNLTNSGFSTVQIDAGNLRLIFGGRVRSANETLPDSGTISLTFFDTNGIAISTMTVNAANVSDRWELVGNQVDIPAGVRTARLRFTEVRNTGTTSDSYLDGAFVYVVPNTFAMDQGAFNTAAGVTSGPVLRIISPDLYVDWLRDKPLPIRWESLGNTAHTTVKIDLYQDGPNGPQFLQTIAPAAVDSGEFDWNAGNSGIAYGTYGLRMQISLAGNPSVFDRGTEDFTVPENTNTFFVNDASAFGDQYTTAGGSNRSTGRIASAPKPLPNTILREYTLGPTQTLFVDSGTYPVFSSIILSGTTGIGDDRAFTFTGPSDLGRTATLTLANPLAGVPVLTLNAADFMTLQHLTLSGGQYGALVENNSTNLGASFVTFSGNSTDGLLVTGSPNLSIVNSAAQNNGQDGIRVQNGSTVQDMGFLTVSGNGADGIFVNGTLVALHDSLITANRANGINLTSLGPVRVEANTVSANGAIGINVANFTAATVTIGNVDLTLNRGNIVSNNPVGGIKTVGSVLVAGNVVSGSTSAGAAGVSLVNNGEVAGNVIFGNANGIIIGSNNNSSVHGNRVYNNANDGIYADQNSPVFNNVVYSNNVGIHLNYFYIGTVSNNLVYANATSAILVQASGGTGMAIVNNTIYQAQGNGLRLENHSNNVQLRNNILYIGGGTGISVSLDSQTGFASDFNDLFTTGTGQVGLWQGQARATLAAWRNADFTDQHSVGLDPRFVNPAGPDGIVGFQSPLHDGRDDDFHEQSQQGSFHNGALAPFINLATGLPITPTASLLIDANQSPAIDAGGATDSFANEPAPNGGYVNIGAYGNTAQASLSPPQYLRVNQPGAGGEIIPQQQSFAINWRFALAPVNNSPPPAGTVNIALLTVGSTAPTLTIASAAANTGQFNWTVPNSVPVGTNYLIQITSNEYPGLTGISSRPFAISIPVSVFYVNDATVTGGDFTSAAGNDINDGLTPATPKATIAGILAAYQLNAGSTILVDAGTYNLSSTLALGASAAGIIIQGYNNAARPGVHTVLDRGNTSSDVIDVQGAANLTLQYLYVTGGSFGINVKDSTASSGVTIANCTVFGNSNTGINIGAAANNTQILNNSVYGFPHDNTNANDQAIGISVGGLNTVVSGVNVSGNVVHDAQTYGIFVTNTTVTCTIQGNEIYACGTGILDGNSATTFANLSTISGNTIHDGTTGINASGDLLITQNVAYGNTGVGILLSNTTYQPVSANIAHDNGTGISGTSFQPTLPMVISNNTVYRNTGDGIDASGDSNVIGNTVYANATGINLIQMAPGFQAANNLVYQNTLRGFITTTNSSPTIINNTVFQPTGDGIDVANFASNVIVRNNILWAQSGFDINVSPNSEVGFQSDYNDLYSTGTGAVGFWEGQTLSTLANWILELNVDRHSLSADPQFVNAAGPDGILGFSTNTLAAAQVIDDTSATGFSTVGAWSTTSAAAAFGGEYLTTPPVAIGNPTAFATWTFTGLVAGATYRVAASWAPLFSLAFDAPFTIFDGTQEISLSYRNEGAAPADFTDLGKNWASLGFFVTNTGSITVQLGNNARAPVAADALRIQQVQGNGAADDNFSLASGSPAVDGGNPTDLVGLEPAPNGGRINLGGQGGTAQATSSTQQVLQVQAPVGLEKLQQGQSVTVSWRTSGLYGPPSYYSGAVLAGQPLAYYRLGDSSGTTAADSSGNGLSATYVGGVQLNAGGALPFDADPGVTLNGSSGFIQLPTITNDFSTGFSAEIWAFPTAVGQNQTFFELGNGFANNNIILQRSVFSNDLVLQVFNVNIFSALVAPNAITLNTWQYFAVTLDGSGNASIYKNGALLVSGKVNAPVKNVIRATNFIGKTSNSSSSLYAGSLDEAAIYASVLTSAQIQAHYAQLVFGSVNIDLLRNGAVVQNIATGVPDNGSFTWTIPTNMSVGTGYQVRLTANDGGQPSGISPQPFQVIATGHDYYVAVNGDDANTGRDPSQPMASLSGLLAAYPVGAGDTVHIAAGTYNLLK